MSYTKGNWKHRIQPGKKLLVDTVNVGTKRLCTLEDYKESPDDARLMAAAPELLEALKKILVVIEAGITKAEDKKVFNNSESVRAALEAIKKATE